ncbi:MAG TPA: peptidoglycan DD-metalloendopeptidase family protein [Solirubrobacteraceae bacterium]
MFADAPPPTAPLTVGDVRVTPRKIFLGRDPARIRFTLSEARATATVELVADKSRRIVRRVVLDEIPAGAVQRVSWDGVTGRRGAAPDGPYRVRLIVPGAGVRRLLGQIVLRGHMYPIRGPHQDRGGIGYFGAPRNGGRTHEGLDVNAACGTPLAAARAGTVTRSRYDPVLYGNEVIIRGWLDGRGYRYAHLRDTPLVKRGDRVRTGEQIGFVGDTGNARIVGCHLHFELRSHTGRLLDPAPLLHAWDRFG